MVVEVEAAAEEAVVVEVLAVVEAAVAGVLVVVEAGIFPGAAQRVRARSGPIVHPVQIILAVAPPAAAVFRVARHKGSKLGKGRPVKCRAIVLSSNRTDNPPPTNCNPTARLINHRYRTGVSKPRLSGKMQPRTARVTATNSEPKTVKTGNRT